MDRSTISQLISGQGVRLPYEQVIADFAAALSVSCDWFSYFSENTENAADILANSFSFEHAPRALVDEQIFQYYQEAVENKIRHILATLPIC